jgi:UDP-N-acetylmuramyl pentapeptide synthase
MRAASSEARQRGITVAEIRDAATAAALASDLLGSNDVVVVKGSRSMGMERVVDALLEEPAA